MGIRPTYSMVKEAFEKDGYTLLSKEYVNNCTKLDYVCSKGHNHSIMWQHWRRGVRCPYCDGQGQPSIEHIKKSFEIENYTLLTTEYKNNRTMLHYICPKGHRHNIRWFNWGQGQRCGICSGHFKLKIESVIKSFTTVGYILLSEEYNGAHSKLSYICPLGHKHSMKWNSWQQGQRCPTCDEISKSGPGNHMWCGGTSFEPYCEVWKDKEYKEDIKIRDGNRCLNPYCDSKNPNDLVIHHIDYNKKNCGPKNLITVCRSCNNKANKERDWHTTWYQAIIKNRYKY